MKLKFRLFYNEVNFERLYHVLFWLLNIFMILFQIFMLVNANKLLLITNTCSRVIMNLVTAASNEPRTQMFSSHSIMEDDHHCWRLKIHVQLNQWYYQHSWEWWGRWVCWSLTTTKYRWWVTLKSFENIILIFARRFKADV